MKKILHVVICSFAILLLAGCKEKAELTNSKETLVSFTNSELNISVNDLYEKLKDKYGTSYIVDMIDKKILDLKYETDDVATKYVDNQIETYETYYGGSDKFLETLQSYGYSTLNEFKENLLLNYKRDLALKDYVRESITDSEIEKYYKNEMFGDITASHILITLTTTDTMTDEEKTAAEESANAKIKEVLEKLENGEDFHELAKTYSEDSATASDGGRLYSFNKGEMDEAFEQAAMDLKVGEYTKKAIRTKYGYHIILKEEEKEKPELNTVKQTIIDNLVEDKISDDSKLQYKALIALRKEYGIVINDETLNTYYDNAVNNWLYGE